MLWGAGKDRGVGPDGLSGWFNLDPSFHTHTQGTRLQGEGDRERGDRANSRGIHVGIQGIHVEGTDLWHPSQV